MSALSAGRYRVVANVTRTLEIFVDAGSASQAEALAEEIWNEHGDESFELKESSFEIAFSKDEAS